MKTYIQFVAEEVPIVESGLRSDLLLELRCQIWIDRKVLVQLVHDLLQDDQVLRKDVAGQVPLRVQLVKHHYLALVDGLDRGRGPNHSSFE